MPVGNLHGGRAASIGTVGVQGRTTTHNLGGYNGGYNTGARGPQATNMLGGGTRYAGTNKSSTFQAGVAPKPVTPVAAKPSTPGAPAGGTLGSTFNSRLESMMNNPGMSEETIEGMINRGTEGIAEAQRDTQFNLGMRANMTGGAEGGAMQAGMRRIATDFGGQRANLARDVRVEAEKDRQTRLMQAMGLASSSVEGDKNRAFQGDQANAARAAADARYAQDRIDRQSEIDRAYTDRMEQRSYEDMLREREARNQKPAGGANYSDVKGDRLSGNTTSVNPGIVAPPATTPGQPTTPTVKKWSEADAEAEKRKWEEYYRKYDQQNGTNSVTPSRSVSPAVSTGAGVGAGIGVVQPAQPASDFGVIAPRPAAPKPSTGITVGGVPWAAPKPGITGANGLWQLLTGALA